ncbi:shufflon system plasmid conjugative transfer pilus tip adhesin PilV [Paraburkholderia megapolitana]|uniref:Shufflon protein, N-terminal constant region n=1 Tax=Paraburkholderia megapolitana TaxID=420953 RepID=A0A1I3DVB4_9BURK|nr:shufflon system plasmid conjugative transfer pilus tip adhesin PilV [Paraburkholderia megapolitana]QDQ79780.1 shufflon system plasmid conjugative transfer pilus tip adhesin PilV [Paraburkholderia megapolitana]SFH90421.1 shufflon protein, N-terminal constant region [Paraburkholderia megapolitana]
MDRTSILKRRQIRRLPGRQRGVTLVEALAALFIGALMIVGVSMMINTSLNDTRDQEVAQYQRQIATAVNDAIKLNYATLLTAVPVGGATTAWTVTDMVANKYIPASYGTTTNAFQQSVCLLFQQPASGQIDALLVSTGGTAIPVAELGYIAANAGVGGGLIDTKTPVAAVGAYGGWNAPASSWDKAPCTLTAGHLANQLFMMGPGNQSTDFLYRNAVPGRPDLNVMNVPIGLTYAKAGDACTNPAITTATFFAADTSNHLLSCIGGLWTPMPWREAVPDVATLAGMAGQVPGETRVTMDTQLPYTWTGTKWVPSAVDNNGAVNFPTFVTEGQPCGLSLDGKAQPDVTNPVQLGVKSDGEVLSCQQVSGAYVWTSTASMTSGTADNGCQIIYPSQNNAAVDYTGCAAPDATQNQWDTVSLTKNNFVYRDVTLVRTGTINVTSYAHMNHAQCDHTNWLAQLTQYLDIMDTGHTTSYSHSEMQSPNILDGSAGVTVTLNKVLQPGTYSVRIMTNWGVFTGDGTGGAAWYSNYCPAGSGTTIIINTPLMSGWSISPVY